MERINALVKEAIAFNEERGDSVNVINAPFEVASTVIEELPAVPLWPICCAWATSAL